MDESNYFEDLTTYSRMISPFSLDGVVNIGWLNIKSGFSAGPVPLRIIEKLKNVACGACSMKVLVEPCRSLPQCDLCGPVTLMSHGKAIPDGELWVPGNGVIYASPVAIIHFMEFHDYAPPQEYIDAVSSMDVASDFYADKLYREKIKESGWFANQFGATKP